MSPNDSLLQSLCRDQETLDTARIVFRLAQKKTGPGSGHELGAHTTGLPAICAYIASQRLNNGEVSRKNAQIASCLKASDFEKAFYIVQAAIGGSRKRTGVNELYNTLIQQYPSHVDRDLFVSWLNAAGRTLIQSDSKLNPEGPEQGPDIKCVIFFWTYNVSMGKGPATQQDYTEKRNIPMKTFNKLLTRIDGYCSSLKIRIQTEMGKRSSPVKVVTTPRRSPTKPALRVLPSKDSSSKRKTAPTQPEFYSSQPDVDMQDIAIPETPTKKRKLRWPSKFTNLPNTLVASSSRITLDKSSAREEQLVPNSDTSRPLAIIQDPMEVNSTPILPLQPDEDDRPLRRRFRPVYLDHKQWYARDKRLKRVWKLAKRHKNKMVELYGHPLDMTGH